MTYFKTSAILVLGVILDQVTKFYARENLETPINIIKDWLKFDYAENTGIAFSLPVAYQILIPLSVLVCLYLGYVLFSQSNLSKAKYWGFLILLTGAVGNLIDRIYFGFVTDFISIWQFPIFNLADTFISLGLIALIWDEVFGA